MNQKIRLHEVNQTFITLIPKGKHPVKLEDFRPICLCNVIYKIVAKLLANRLKNILDEVISLTQSTFVLGKLITNNMLIAYEILHSITTRLKGNKRYMTLELDMSKTYDRI